MINIIILKISIYFFILQLLPFNNNFIATVIPIIIILILNTILLANDGSNSLAIYFSVMYLNSGIYMIRYNINITVGIKYNTFSLYLVSLLYLFDSSIIIYSK